MSQSKREKFLKENERYPLRSLTSDQRALYLHEEDLADKREKAADKRREDKKEEKQQEAEDTAAAKNYEVTPKEKK